MKLIKKWPDRSGTWWCWCDGMARSVTRELQIIQHVDDPNNRYLVNLYKGGGVWIGLEKCDYTHFAGPIERPELPEPERMEVEGTIFATRRLDGSFLYLLDAGEVPDGLRGAPVKVTIERLGP